MFEGQFEGKVAIVTGGASGIGHACAVTLAKGGAKLVIADIDDKEGAEAVSELKGMGAEAVFTRTDVSDAQSVEEMVNTAVRRFGQLDIAVNNAGIGGDQAPAGEYPIDAWRQVIGINLDGVFYCMRYEIPVMLRQGSGSIVNISSILGRVGFMNSPAYVASKHGVVGLTRAAALDYGEDGLRINAVGPGFISTPLVLGNMNDAAQMHIAGLHAMGRMGEPQEVANMVAFLCSDRATFLTGGYYPVDGGYTAQ